MFYPENMAQAILENGSKRKIEDISNQPAKKTSLSLLKLIRNKTEKYNKFKADWSTCLHLPSSEILEELAAAVQNFQEWENSSQYSPLHVVSEYDNNRLSEKR